jgi:acetylornithine aminotransferase/acetylornithine/N-succinyldiaminopimelate aminotransferase
MTNAPARPTTNAGWVAIEQATFFANRRPPVVIERGQGSRVWDVEGREYLDLIAGIAVNALGHSSPVVQRALAEQSSRLIHISNLFYSIPQLELAQLLMSQSPFNRVFFCNSGAEANEAAIKLARRWGKRHRDGAFAVITAEQAFHGRTLATVTATGKEAYTRPFAPLPEGFPHVPFNDMDALERTADASTVGVLLEPIQGESGVNVADETYLRDVQDFCRAKGLLFMVDEVQTGVGRLGTLWGFERWGVEPDIMTLAKGLGGGVPIGAMLAKESVAAFEPGDHGSTFGGNPLMCAVAFAVVTHILEHDVLGNVKRVGGYIKHALETLKAEQPLITTVRGEGLLLAFDLSVDRAPDVVRFGLDEGVLLNATGPNTLRVAPALTLTQAEAEEGIAKLKRALARLDAPQSVAPAA